MEAMIYKFMIYLLCKQKKFLNWGDIMQGKSFLDFKVAFTWGLIFVISFITLAFLPSTPAYAEDSIVWEKMII